MKCASVCLLGLLAVCQIRAETINSSTSPVSRVVELIRGLSKQVENDGKKEEDLYESFVCWGKSVVEQKSASNVAAQSRIDTLKTYIADLDAGRIELTTERVDLEKDIEELKGELEVAAGMRKKSKADFDSAETEMVQAVNALESAVDVLGVATKGKKKSALVAVRQQLAGGMSALLKQQTYLKTAVELSQKFLSKSDGQFLRRVLLGDVPQVDWKKLNRKATFKMAYKARSTKIQDVLSKMHNTFTSNLADARAKESDAKASFEKLSTAKQGQLDSAEESLSKQEVENGARGMSKADSQDELKSLQTQVSNDNKFIKDTNQALADKKAEWKERSELRSAEIAAFSKAIFILHNDDARDLMKKSYSSQGLLFLQVDESAQVSAARSAASAIRDAARQSGDTRLLALAAGLASPSAKLQFGPVIKGINKMIEVLTSDEQKDLETKQTCEKDRMENTKSALEAGHAIDDMTDVIARLTEEIGDLNKDIEGLQKDHDHVSADLAQATRMRKDQHAAFVQSDKDDAEAAATVGRATKVLSSFYKENKLSLAQKAAAPVVEAGAAPPPPPATFGAGDQLKSEESVGIIALLTMVQADIEKDRAAGQTEEDNSQKEFDAFKKDCEAQMKELTSDMNARSKTLGSKETKKSATEKSRGTTKEQLDSTMSTMKKINPNCEYYEVNYSLRRDNRHIERDGLNKAKAILTGGTFNAGPDPNREIKPGDAFLQKHA